MIRVIAFLIILVGLFNPSPVFSQTDLTWALTTSVDNQSPYVGETITYTIQIRYPDNDYSFVITEPIFEGFGRLSYQDEPTITRESVDQVPYLISTQSITLLPLRAGVFTIDPYQITTSANPFQEGENISSESIIVSVMSLPSDQPANYINAVGQYSIDLQTSHTDVIVGEPFRLTMTISGTGNLEQIIPPEPALPVSWHIIESHYPVVYENNRFGTRHFEWTIIPTNTDVQGIPQVNFVYFNPGIDAFETRQTASIPLRITDSSPQQQSITSMPRMPDDTRIPYLVSSGPELLELPEWVWIILLIGSPLLPVVVWGVRKVIRVQEPQQRSRPLSLNALQDQLNRIDISDTSQGFIYLERIVLGYIVIRTKRNWTLSEFMTTGNTVDEGLYRQLSPILEEISAAKYAPVSSEDLVMQIKRFRQIIRLAEKR